jgi:hypothetical protein
MHFPPLLFVDSAPPEYSWPDDQHAAGVNDGQPGNEVRLRIVGEMLRDSQGFCRVSITMMPSYDPAVPAAFAPCLFVKENDTP